MNTSELIEMLQEFEETAGGPVTVQVLVRNNDRNQRFTLDQYDVDLDDHGSGQTVLIDLS